MTAIFISHSSRDELRTQELKDWLAAEGYERVFLDFDKETGLPVGADWERRLYEEIARCHLVLLLLTPNWLDSKWCFAEFTQARALGKIIFPILLSPLGEKRVAPEIQGIDLKEWNAEGQDHLRRRIREVTDELARGFQWDRSRSPYPGIFAFEREDAAIFFGRDEETRDVIERLEARRVQGGKRFLCILGSSGSGKSSLLKAGVLPQLERLRAQWVALAPFRPEREPLTGLAKSVADRLGGPSDWRHWKERLGGPERAVALKELCDDLRVKEARDATLLISIDQFEETFTLAAPNERASFLDLLQAAVASSEPLPCLVVATARSDALGDILRSRQFSLPFENYALRPMPLDRLPKVIEGPAATGAVTVEKGLCERIAQDTKSAEALPLLAFTLRELYERMGRQRHAMSIADYEKLGDRELGLNPIESAINRKAADVIELVQPSATQMEALKRTFIPNLVRIRDDGSFVRQPARIADLPPESRSLVTALIEARLLARRAEPTADAPNADLVEVSHEALFKAWPLLAGWLNGEREFLAGKTQLEKSLQEWQRSPAKEKHEALLQGLALKRARQWLVDHPGAFSSEEERFIKSSVARARRRRLTIAGLTVASLLVLAGWGGARLYAEYTRMTALDCDLLAAEVDNNVGVRGVEFDSIDTAKSIPACRSAVNSDSDNPRLIHELARSLDKAGQYDEAVSWYRKAANLGFAWSQNNLGVMYLAKRGVPLDFERAAEMMRAAAEQNNDQAIVNYTETDYTLLFEGVPETTMVLAQALASAGFLEKDDISDRFGPAIRRAVEDFKRKLALPDPGITLRVIDRLGVAGKIRPREDRGG
jgi:tetratricopeptide (TPR) repeat protein